MRNNGLPMRKNGLQMRKNGLRMHKNGLRKRNIGLRIRNNKLGIPGKKIEILIVRYFDPLKYPKFFLMRIPNLLYCGCHDVRSGSFFAMPPFTRALCGAVKA